MTAAVPLVVCGTGFGPLDLAALMGTSPLRTNPEFQLMGQLAEDGHPARKLAEQGRIAHWTRLEQLPPGIRAGWVSATGHGVSTGERAADLLGRGISVLVEPPFEYSALVECIRQARRTQTCFRLAQFVANMPASRRFAGAARALGARVSVRHVAARCTRGSLQALFHLVGNALPRLRPWQVHELTRLPGGLVILGGSLADVPLVLRVRNEETPGRHAAIEIVVDSHAGELALTCVHGRITWTPRPAGAAVVLGSHPDPARRETGGWLRSIRAELTAFARGLDNPEKAIAGAQYQLTLRRLTDEALAVLGPPMARANPEVVPVAELAAAAIEAAGDDDDCAVDELPDSDEAHRAGLAGLPSQGASMDELAHVPQAMRRLEAISLGAIETLLLATGALTKDGRARTTEQILLGLGTAPRHAWLVRRWLVALMEQGVVAKTANGYRWHRTLPDGGTAADLPDAYEALGFPPKMADVHRAALEQLANLVRDEVSIQQLAFRDGQVLTALAAYQDNVFTAYLNAASAYLIRRYAHMGQVPLRVIELGGGAGLTTEAALQALDGTETDYLFTDISRVFAVAARQRFGEGSGHGPGFRCHVLDINRDFAAQGVAPCAADVVLAGNVLHNATHIGRTLRRIRRVLTPGGWLVFTESTRENHAILTAMQFLLSPPSGAPLLGSEDRRAGTDHVFVDTPGWNAELQAAGFVPRIVLPAPESPLAVAGQNLFFATTC
ncbi:MAG: bifunctional Gfo/Idh/MocA family oxidoreductase/class I SAM-dependent methyltransferase [Proteobacteria bacterium]|nr:bifunctional Gfo/Idh/MocA family oxidoreductase/class I SAM-dependent methyltransferase [Pseudomonadota bacterium]